MKRAAFAVGLLVFAFLLPILLVGVVVLIPDQPSPTEKARAEIPPDLIAIYQAAANTCQGLDWTVLAAIHKLETGFGTGPATSHKGAQGPMQFLPSTFETYGVDGDRDGRVDLNDVVDAVFSAAYLLCANGAGDPSRLASAVWNYNHSQTYVSEVLTLASGYGEFAIPGDIAYAATSDLLGNPRVILTPRARADLLAGIVDQRLISLLAWVAGRHTITVTVFKTGHSTNTSSGRVSLHHYGRAADIFFVDGRPVGITNLAARQVVLELTTIGGTLRPSELGHPFGAIGFPGGFTDADHAGHIHIGFN